MFRQLRKRSETIAPRRIVARGQAIARRQVTRIRHAHVIENVAVGLDGDGVTSRRKHDLRINVDLVGHGNPVKHVERCGHAGNSHRGGIVDPAHRDLILTCELIHVRDVAAGDGRNFALLVSRVEEGLDRARSLKGAVGEHAVDLLSKLLNQGRHHGLAGGGIPVGVLHLQNIDIRVFREDLLIGADADLGGAGAGDAGQHHNVSLGFQIFAQPLRLDAADRCVGGGDERDVVLTACYLPIDHDDGNALLHRAADNRVQRLFGRRRNQQKIHPTAGQVLDIRDLFRRIVVGVGDEKVLDLIGVLARGPKHAVLECDAPCVGDRGVGKPYDVGTGLLPFGCLDHGVETRVPEPGSRHAEITLLGRSLVSERGPRHEIRCAHHSERRRRGHGGKPAPAGLIGLFVRIAEYEHLQSSLVMSFAARTSTRRRRIRHGRMSRTTTPFGRSGYTREQSAPPSQGLS